MLKQQVSWKKQNKQLVEAAQTNVQLKKQINKESDMDSLIQDSINDKIYQLKQQATALTKKFQNQKHKNAQLQTIIKTIRYRMDDDRKVQADSLTDPNYQNIEGLQRKIKKYEYDLQQINARTNRTGSAVSDKKHRISLLRTQRVIDSSIFRNIEKQLIGSQMQFKKLLIDKIRHQKIYQQCLNEYTSLKAKAQVQFQNQQTQTTTQSAINQNEGQQSCLIDSPNKGNNNNKFKQIRRQANQLGKTSTKTDFSKQEQSLHYQFRIKKFFMNLNIENAEQFLYLFLNVQKINDMYYSTLNTTADQISHLQEQINKLQETIKRNIILFYRPKADLTKKQKQFICCQNLMIQIKRNQAQTVNYTKQLHEFMGAQNFIKVSRFVGVPVLATEDMDLQSSMQLLKQIESKISKLNCHQFPQSIQESNVLKSGRTDRQKRQQKLQDVMNRVKVHQQSDKIMKKQQFKEQYRKMLQTGPGIGTRNHLKKKIKKIVL